MYETSKIKYISYPLIIIIDFDTGGKTNRNKKKKVGVIILMPRKLATEGKASVRVRYCSILLKR